MTRSILIAIVATLAATTVSGVVRHVFIKARSREARRSEDGALELRIPLPYCVMGVVLLLVGACVGAHYLSQGQWIGWIGVGFVPLGGYLAAMRGLYQIDLDPGGLRYREPGRRGSLTWANIASIELRPGSAYRLHTTAGPHVDVSIFVTGLAELAQALLEHVPSERYSRATHESLRAAVSGTLPRVVGLS